MTDAERAACGGTAFPAPAGGPPGMTLRDFFAAHAAGGILAGLVGDDAVKLRPEAPAAMAFWVADALLAARAAPPAGEETNS